MIRELHHNGFDWYGHPNVFYASGKPVVCRDPMWTDDGDGELPYWWAAIPLGESGYSVWLYVYADDPERDCAAWIMLQYGEGDDSAVVMGDEIHRMSTFTKDMLPGKRLLTHIMEWYSCDIEDADAFLLEWAKLSMLRIVS